MRIGLVTGEFPPMEGGVGAFTRELAKALAAQDHEIHIITHREARPELLEGQRYGLRQLREPVELDYALLHPRARRWGWRDVQTVADVALRYELDVVNIQYQAAAYNMRSPAINFAPWRLKGLAMVVVTYHDLRVPYLFPKAGTLRRAVVRWSARLAHGVIVTNYEDYKSLADVKAGSRLRQIPIGSNIAVHKVRHEEVERVRKGLGVRPEHFLLGYFGFLNESKGADILIRALAKLNDDVHLVFIGGNVGSSDAANNQGFLQQLRQLVDTHDLGERVHWTGFVPDEVVSQYLCAADLISMPYRDGVSLRRGTLMAAFAHGRPTVSTEPTVASPEIRHGENIWLVNRDDDAALTNAIRHLRQTPALRETLGEGASQIARRFTWEHIASETVDFYAALTT